MSDLNKNNSQNQPNQEYYDEISLRELIETLIGGWKIIALVTALFIVIAGVYSYAVLDPTYEAKTVLLASNASEKVKTDSTGGAIEDTIDTLRESPVTIDTYKEQIKMPEILDETIADLNLSDQGITKNKLAKMINLGTIKNTQMITITVTNTDKQLAVDIANSISDKFVQFLTRSTETQVNRSAVFIEKQMNTERENLDAALVAYKDFLGQSESIEEIQSEKGLILSELNALKSQLSKEETSYQESLVKNTAEQRTLETSLATLKSQLEATDQTLVTESSVLNDSLMSDMVSESTGKSKQSIAGMSLRNEEINENYMALEKQINSSKLALDKNKQARANLTYSHDSRIKILNDKIAKLTKRLDELQLDLADKQHKEKLLQRKINLAQSSYDNFASKYEQARIAQASVLESSNINIVSRATLPESPVGPRKALNMAIAAVLGVMVSMFGVFFGAYWRATE